MSKIEDFLKVQCGDPAKGAFEAPLTFDGLLELFQTYDLMLADEHGGLPEVLELPESSFSKGMFDLMKAQMDFIKSQSKDAAVYDAIFRYVQSRKSPCKPTLRPSQTAMKLTGAKEYPMVLLLGCVERYMDEHPEEFGTIKIDNNGGNNNGSS